MEKKRLGIMKTLTNIFGDCILDNFRIVWIFI